MIWLLATAAFAQSIPSTSGSDSSIIRLRPDFGAFETNDTAQNVVNGSTTSDFEAVGGLFAVDTDDQIYAFCSGTLITEDTVLTAAHCVDFLDDLESQISLSGFVFVLGTDLSETGIHDYAWFSDAQMHPDYDTNTLEWDLGLIHLDTKITSTKPMCLNSDEVDDDWEDVDIDYVGWGMTAHEDGASMGVKRTVQIPVVDFDPTHIITYREDVNICNGDSGGAAFVEREDGTRMLAGVNSYGFNINGGSPDCDRDGAAGASARVDSSLEWIQDETDALTCDEEPPTETPPTGGPTSLNDDSSGKEYYIGCSATSASGTFGMALLSLLGLVRRRQS